MALPNSGAISLQDIQNEFGGSNPIGINEYYGVASGVPASGTISFDDFYGKSAFSLSGLIFHVDAGITSSYPGSGTTWTDISTSGLTGTFPSDITFSSSDGGSLSFPGTGAGRYVSFGASSATVLNGLTEITVEIWFKSDATSNDNGLMFGGTPFNTEDNGLSVRYDSSGFSGGGTNLIKAGFGAFNSQSGANFIESSSNIQSTSWTCIHVLCDLNTSISLYENGTLDTPKTSSTGTATSISNCNSIIIGSGRSGDLWDGNISNVKIYNRLLSSSEITQNFNALKGRYGL